MNCGMNCERCEQCGKSRNINGELFCMWHTADIKDIYNCYSCFLTEEK